MPRARLRARQWWRDSSTLCCRGGGPCSSGWRHTPHAARPTPHAARPTPHAPRPTPQAPRPTPHAPKPHAPSPTPGPTPTPTPSSTPSPTPSPTPQAPLQAQTVHAHAPARACTCCTPCTLDLQARADLNGRHCTVLEPSSGGRFPTRVDGVVAATNRDETLEALGEELDACLRGGTEGGGTEGGARRGEEARGQPPEGELVRVRPRNLWPSSN
jgi:hypothetical protein